jgi:hypothetical protein
MDVGSFSPFAPLMIKPVAEDEGSGGLEGLICCKIEPASGTGAAIVQNGNVASSAAN